jgi:hypothetical protein
MPAEAGIQKTHDRVYRQPWTPAFAGVTAHAEGSSTPFQNGLFPQRPGMGVVEADVAAFSTVMESWQTGALASVRLAGTRPTGGEG